MTDLNDVILIGRITKDVGSDEGSFSFVGNGTAKAVASLAVNRSVKKGDSWEDEVSYIDCEIWGKTAENLKDKLVKGKQVCIRGYLKQDRWEKDGQKQSRLKVVAETVQLLGGGKSSESNPFEN